MTFELYVMPASAPCRAVLMLVNELGLDVQIKEIDLLKGEQHSEEFLNINWQHCVPTLVDKDSNFVLWESRAIMQYLVAKLAPNHSFYPDSIEARALIDKMLYFDCGILAGVTSAMVAPLIFTEATEINDEHENKFKSKLDLLERALGMTDYVAGSMMSIADLSIFATLSQIDILDYDLSNDYPNVTAWRQKVQEEITCNFEVNEEPLSKLKEWLMDKKNGAGKD